MNRKIEMDHGCILEVKDVMVDVDGTNLEEGIDVYTDTEYLGSMVGYDAATVTVEDLKREIY